MKTKIFVYGTLRQNFANHRLLATSKFLGFAKTESKYVMHCMGAIPFVSKSQAISQILGEVYEVDNETLKAIDQLEGCIPSITNPKEFDSNSWYTRSEVAVEFLDFGQFDQVWLYFNEGGAHHPIISSGDYADYKKATEISPRYWYFAYGSNMNASRMLKRKAHFTKRVMGVLRDYRLVFNKISDNNPGFGFANIVPENGFEVLGILYEVNDAGLKQLDRYEGVSGGHYTRTKMEIQKGDGSPVEAVVYLGHPNKIKEGLIPTEEYKQHLNKGLDILGDVGMKYLEQSFNEAKVTNEPEFLAESDIPNPADDDHDGDVREKALPVFINGHKAKIFTYDSMWSPRLVLCFEPNEAIYFRNLGLNVDEMGFSGTKYYYFLRRGILVFGEHRFVVARNEN